MVAYYNEIDPYAAQWLRNLSAAKQIATAKVDERSIVDVKPDDLRGFTQCHFFAGIGVWSYALRCAQWADNREIWTGSCPCQPFSAAGKKAKFTDERHLWPQWYRLIVERKPNVIIGEQVAGKDGLAWLDVVQSDLENAGYSVGAIDTCAASFGAPHIRQRLFFVAEHRQRLCRPDSNVVADAARTRWQPRPAQRKECSKESQSMSTPGVVLGGFWRNAEWIDCSDGKIRPVEPGTFPLVARTATSMGQLCAYGNAIVAPQAQAFIETYMEITDASL